MPALFDLAGRVAVVTGGNGGIGRSIALGLAEAGASVAIFGRNDEKNQQVLSELKAIGVPSIAVKIDLTDRAALEPALSRVASELGGIGILVNNAGNVSLSGGILHEKLRLGQRHRDATQRSLPSLEAGRLIDDESSRREDHQHWQYVLVLWIWANPASKDRRFHGNRSRLGKCLDPAVQFAPCRSGLAVLKHLASRILDTVTDRLLVYIQSDIVHLRHGGASVVVR
jgi:hypothetical protein